MKYRIARLMGVIGLTCGGVASLVMLLNFCMEACCMTSGVQYGLGVMYAVAVVTQGLTFLGIDGRNCREYGCVISSTATWSILACCLYFIAFVHAFTVPFPRERICSSEICCPCCGRDEDEGAEEEIMDEEAPAPLPEEEEGDDLAKAAVTGAAAGAGGAVVIAATADDNNNEEETFDDEEGGAAAVDDPNAAAAVGTAGVATANGDEGDDADKDLKASVSADAAAASEDCATMASNLIGSAISACAPSTEGTDGGAQAESSDGK